jgi:16S rRNA (uracil1498-N3)-methyltransferase
MSTPRFYCTDLTPGLVTLDASESRHALQSLRLRPGEEAILFDGRGRVAHGVFRLAHVSDTPSARRRAKPKSDRATLAVERVLCEPPPVRTLALIVAGCKGPRLTWMVEKLTELGTNRIVLAEFERSVVRVGPAHAVKLRRTALAAAKQSCRIWLPDITCGLDLLDAISDAAPSKLLVAHPLDEGPPLLGRLHAHDLSDDHVTAVVGPEGGLSEGELAMVREAGGELVRLAPTILRVETAAISLAANWAAQQPD